MGQRYQWPHKTKTFTLCLIRPEKSLKQTTAITTNPGEGKNLIRRTQE